MEDLAVEAEGAAEETEVVVEVDSEEVENLSTNIVLRT